jgi:hypothetical protein
MTERWTITFEMDVHGDRDPREWVWPNLIEVDDEVDHVDWSTLTVTTKEATA